MANRESPTEPPAQISTVRISLSVAATISIFTALVFMPAGRLNWVLGWIYLGLLSIDFGISWVCLQRWNPELIERRMRIGKGTKTWDIVWAVLYAPVAIAVYLVAGLDARDGVSSLPIAVWPIGLTIFVLGAAMLAWAMVVNPFFEKTVRIQTEHGHRVIDTGPYVYVRHPGYVGFAGWIFSVPFLLASAWAIVPALLAVVGIAIRTALEDRTLYAELPGYPEYSERVRFRLIPGVW